MTGFVLDASVALAWCFEDGTTPATNAVVERLTNEEAAAPAIWRLEVANALATAERRGRLSVAALARSMALLQRLAVTIDGEGSDRAFRDLLDLARSERLSVYDATYFELALQLGVPLASKYRSLRTAGARLGVSLLGA